MLFTDEELKRILEDTSYSTATVTPDRVEFKTHKLTLDFDTVKRLYEIMLAQKKEIK